MNAQVAVVGCSWGIPGAGCAAAGIRPHQREELVSEAWRSCEQLGAPGVPQALELGSRVSGTLGWHEAQRNTGPLGWRWGCRLLASGNGGKEATMEMLSPGALVGCHLPTGSCDKCCPPSQLVLHSWTLFLTLLHGQSTGGGWGSSTAITSFESF